MVLLKARGFKSEDYAEMHPGGNLGRQLLTRVTDIMRQGDQLAQVGDSDTVASALKAMTRCRAGAVVVTNKEGQLKGILTHGDFVRAYQDDRNVADHPVSDHMTRNPITINGGKLAAEAVRTFEQNRIDDIVVTGDEDRVIGLIDVQDLTRTGIF